MVVLASILRTVVLAIGYTLPMLLLFSPFQIPARFLWASVAEHRGTTDFFLILACPAMVWLVQTHWTPTAAASGADDELVSFSVGELYDATDGFGKHTELGHGGFSIVHGTRGRLRSLLREGRCAVKRLHDAEPATFQALQAEVRLLGKCRHENLLPLLGFCLDSRDLCLVYPLMTGGNLDDRLRRSPEALQRISLLRPPGQRFVPALGPLGWRERVRILRDVTRALLYLHTPKGHKGVVLHRDVKPTNILLDEQLNAKLADIGLATEAHELSAGRTHVSSRSLVGTAGFVDPLYANSGQYSQLTDGYAMGMTLLVCLTSRPALEALDAAEGALELPRLAHTCADPEADWPETVSQEVVELVVGLAWRRTARSRMSLADALRKLEKVADASNTRPGIAAQPDGPRECVVCMAAPRAVRYRCGHCLCCEACTALLERCPSCRVAPIHVVARGEVLAFEESFVRPEG